jgi:exopolysaccharide biosynthesis polyprenyl glycosylphosphotransferase
MSAHVRTSARLRLTAAERRWLLRSVDVLILNLDLLLILAVRYDYGFSLSTLFQVPLYFLLLTVLWFVWAAFFDCYDLSRCADASQSGWSTAVAGLLTAVTYLFIPYVTPYLTASRLSALLFTGLVVCSLVAWRALYAHVLTQPTFRQRLLIVGAGRSGAELARELAGVPSTGSPYAGSGFEVVGFVDDNPAKAGAIVAGAPVLGDRYAIRQLIPEHKVDTLVLAVSSAHNIHPELFQILLDCREQGIHLEPMTSLYERLTGKVPVEHAGRSLQLILPPSDIPSLRVFWVAKRVFDLGAGLLGLAIVAALAPWVALANAILCPGPLFYEQTRVGQGGRPFQLSKFRSMIPNAEAERGPVWASSADCRVTPVGRFLRRAHLDELPQFWNVLKGEMSVVGPRPERPGFVAELLPKVPFYQARHAVRPGITGWAQVRYEYGSSEQDALVKLQFDLYYIKHQSLYLELSILVKTAAVMLRLKGR